MTRMVGLAFQIHRHWFVSLLTMLRPSGQRKGKGSTMLRALSSAAVTLRLSDSPRRRIPFAAMRTESLPKSFDIGPIPVATPAKRYDLVLLIFLPPYRDTASRSSVPTKRDRDPCIVGFLRRDRTPKAVDIYGHTGSVAIYTTEPALPA